MRTRILAATLVLLLSGCTGAVAHETGPKTNVVLVLTDDLATNLLPYMPQVQALARDGVRFANYTVTDSLCCPSRSSLFTGKFPHDTGVFTNGGDDGGYGTFTKRGNANSTFATDLQKAGYRTAMYGKYLNGYLPKDKVVPPGWTEWAVAGNGYPEYNYSLLENGQVKHYGHEYLTDVISAKAQSFIRASADADQPFLVEVATFAPHSPYTPADEDKNKFPGLTAPRTAAFDTLPTDPPKWLASRTPLTDAEKKAIDRDFRKRAQAVQSVDRMVGALRKTLEDTGVADHTLVVFTSDNGYHMGERRLTPGKQTAFDTDVTVPLIMAGPGIAAGTTMEQPAENIDLRPTFADLAGAATPDDVNGRSLRPLLTGATANGWRTAALIEHHGPDSDPQDPDNPPKNSGNPPTYQAIRTAGYTYVEYADGGKEFYADPDQLHNTVSSLSPARLAELHQQVVTLTGCHQHC